MLLASQGRAEDSNHKTVQEQPRVPSEDIVAMDNDQDKEALISSRGSKRPKVKIEKAQASSEMGRTPILQQEGKAIVSEQNLHKKPRKFETPLQKAAAAVIKRGLEVGLISPQSRSMVAFATIQATDSKHKATDGQPLDDCVEVLINTVFSKTTLLPRSQEHISKLASAVGRCIPWPRKNLEPLDDGSGDRRTSKVPSAAGIPSVQGVDKESAGKKRKLKKSSSPLDDGSCDPRMSKVSSAAVIPSVHGVDNENAGKRRKLKKSSSTCSPRQSVSKLCT